MRDQTAALSRVRLTGLPSARWYVHFHRHTGEATTTTNRDYDLGECRKQVPSILIGMAIMAVSKSLCVWYGTCLRGCKDKIASNLTPRAPISPLSPHQCT